MEPRSPAAPCASSKLGPAKSVLPDLPVHPKSDLAAAGVMIVAHPVAAIPKEVHAASSAPIGTTMATTGMTGVALEVAAVAAVAAKIAAAPVGVGLSRTGSPTSKIDRCLDAEAGSLKKVAPLDRRGGLALARLRGLVDFRDRFLPILALEALIYRSNRVQNGL